MLFLSHQRGPRRSDSTRKRCQCSGAPQYQSLEQRLPLTTFVVTTVDDVIDANDGFVSLREAVTAANLNEPFSDASPGEETGDRVVFSDTLGNRQVTLTGGQLVITDDLILRGRSLGELHQTTISDFGNTGRSFRISTSERVYMRDLTFLGSIGNSGSGGIGALDRGSDAVFVGVDFIGGTAAEHGGALFVSSSSLRIVDSVFASNRSEVSGGAIAAFGDSIIVARDSTFGGERGDGNRAGRFGGAVAISGNAQFVTNSDFLDNMADGGGAIHATDQTKINIYGGDITSNSGTNGGAVYSAGETLFVANTTFSDNDGIGGGAIQVDGASSVLQNVTFEGNIASGAGGALAVQNGSKMYVDESTFERNISLGSAGAIFVNESNFVIQNSNLESNEAHGVGGAILFSSLGETSNEMRIVNSNLFSNSSDDRDGGAIFARGGLSVITDSTFDGNRTNRLETTANGGAIFATLGSRMLIFGSEFTNNESSNGGAIYHRGEYMLLSDSEVSSNSAAVNGGGILTRSRMAIVGSTITGNSATSGGGGGAMVVGEGRLVSREGSLFSSNSASRGGAIGVFDARAFIDDTRFESNTASLSGGAIIAQFMGSAFISASTFESNVATENGSAINVEDSGLVTSSNSRYESNRIDSDAESGVVHFKDGGFFGSDGDVFEGNVPNDDVTS